MNFLISDTFTGSLGRLTGDEQKAVKITVFDLQSNPANPGLNFHKLDRARDRKFWSVRVNLDLRLIVHRSDGSLLVCFVGRHDDAYTWAERRKLERHPHTGAAQFVEVRETVKEIEIPRYVEVETPTPEAEPKPALFLELADEELLQYGVPEEWFEDVRAADEDRLLGICDHLPAEAAEALLQLATGNTPVVTAPVGVEEDPFSHPDAQRRFRVVENLDQLELALDFPWEKWTVFLHPEQRNVVEREFQGPARVAGSAGTGKTIVALHRARHLARQHPEARVLVTTFALPLARRLRTQLRRLVGQESDLLDRVAVHDVNELGLKLYEEMFGTPLLAQDSMIRTLLKRSSSEAPDHKFSDRFLESEWHVVVDDWQLHSWEAYRDVPRLGRKKRLGEKQRELLWGIFESVQKKLRSEGLVTMPMIYSALEEHLRSGDSAPYDFAVIDEAQDVNVSQLRFFSALAGSQPNGLFFAGDMGQRIFQTPFSWKSLGVDVRGRSHTLKINYRTSHQIRRQADRLLPPGISDVDGNDQDRRGTVSVFNGPEPAIQVFDSEEAECASIAKWIEQRIEEGCLPHEMAIFVRSQDQVERARLAADQAGYPISIPEAGQDPEPDKVAVMQMHLAKGLEFKSVIVAACDDEILPLESRLLTATEESDLKEVYETERQLLYVACTRARDHLLVTGVKPASVFLDDMSAELR
ncbi:MAG: UvrD-helicase domain-containing protein [Candidatus Latescibacteria bacterium]|nr:UvrD-helicase domain-containing protein [Candidatus Latescibacterota bacterium]